LPKTISKGANPRIAEFVLIGSAELDRRLGMAKAQRVALMKRLPSPIYHHQFPGGKKVFWNWVLVQDYLMRGNTTDPAHLALVEEYVATLPGYQR
jgi:hypothetical protein